MNAAEREVLRELTRQYEADLLRRCKRAPCPECGAPPGKPCIFSNGPNRGREMAGRHGARADEAARLGYVRGKNYRRSRR